MTQSCPAGSGDTGDLTSILHDCIARARHLIPQGRPYQDIPTLRDADPSRLGVAVVTKDGRTYAAGDADYRFSIQSISKVFTLARAMQCHPAESIWQRVGKEPSGQMFNSLIQLEAEGGIPRNPFINSGALIACDLLASLDAAPDREILLFLQRLSGNRGLHSAQNVSRYERKNAHRHMAMAYLMKSFENFENDVGWVVSSYFHNCAIEMSCVDLAQACHFLASQGYSEIAQERILTPQQTRQFNAVMATCGLYNGVGDFAFRVGLPAKSGIGGGVVAVIPNDMSICAFSPGLDAHGNSLAGVSVLEHLTDALQRSVF